MSVTTTAPRTSVRYPARLTKDVRIAVTIEEPSTPFPIVVYFLDIYEKENPDARALIAVGIELGHRYHRDQGFGDRLPKPLDRDAVQQVTARFREYVEYARACVAFRAPPNPPSTTPGSRPRRRRRALTDDFLQRIAEQYQAWSDDGRAVSELAEAHGVNRSTASRWVQAARDRGFLPQIVTEPLGHAGRDNRASSNRRVAQRAARAVR